MNCKVRISTKADAQSIASIHIKSLQRSFLSTLGPFFLNRLYLYLIEKEQVWVIEENDEIMGFLSFSMNSSRMMRRFLFHCPVCMLIISYKISTSFYHTKRIWETFRIPSKLGNRNEMKSELNLPTGELLSIAIKENFQTTGLGGMLLNKLEEFLLYLNISNYKVFAGDNLLIANQFYLKHDFKLVGQIRFHGNDISNVYIKEINLK